MTEEARPGIPAVRTGAELRDWYWLKAELLAECRRRGLSTVGAKADLTDRLAHFLDTGHRLRPAARKTRSKPSGPVTSDTVIGPGYRNGQAERAFFTARIGPAFRFTIDFMAWIDANHGRTMGEAADEWRRQAAEKKAGKRQAIPTSNQWNAYQRAFFAANPDRSLDDARACWAAKRARRGHNRYETADLSVLG